MPTIQRQPVGGAGTASPTSTDWARASAYGAKVPPLKGFSGSVVQTVSQYVAGAVTPDGCTDVGAFQRVNDFLDFGGGLGSGAVVAIASLVDPVLGIGAAAAIGAFQSATGDGCVSTAPVPLSTSSDVAAGTQAVTDYVGALPPPVAVVDPEVLSRLRDIETEVLHVLSLTVQPCILNREFWIAGVGFVPMAGGEPGEAGTRWFDLAGIHYRDKPVDVAVVAWLDSVLPVGWHVAAPSETGAEVWCYPPGSGTTAFAIFVGDMMDPVQRGDAWVKDFSVHYQYTLPGDEQVRSTLGDVVYFLDTSMWRPRP
jgi:hypothetical protein